MKNMGELTIEHRCAFILSRRLRWQVRATKNASTDRADSQFRVQALFKPSLI